MTNTQQLFIVQKNVITSRIYINHPRVDNKTDPKPGSSPMEHNASANQSSYTDGSENKKRRLDTSVQAHGIDVTENDEAAFDSDEEDPGFVNCPSCGHNAHVDNGGCLAKDGGCGYVFEYTSTNHLKDGFVVDSGDEIDKESGSETESESESEAESETDTESEAESESGANGDFVANGDSGANDEEGDFSNSDSDEDDNKPNWGAENSDEDEEWQPRKRALKK